MEEAGIDISEAAAILASAQTSLDVAAAEIATIDADVSAAITAEDPREAWQSVKVQYQMVRDQLRTAHSEIKSAVTALKRAVTAADLSRSEAVRNNPSTSEAEDEEESAE